MYRLTLFGIPRLTENGRPLQVETRKAMGLLLYLAVTERAHSRSELAAMFWPNNDKTAGASLRRAIWAVRRQAGKDLLVVERHALSTNAATPLQLDTTEFWALTGGDGGLGLEQQAAADGIPDLLRAVDLYQADFLHDFTLTEAPLFDDWRYFERDRFAVRLSQILNFLTGWYRDNGNLDAALAVARRHLEADPLYEPGHRAVMELMARMGRRQDALAQYELCKTMLESELALKPDAETVDLARVIRQGALLASQARETIDLHAAGGHPAIHPYPRPLAPLIGRTQEMYRLAQFLTVDNHRLITLVGPGGMGKSRLAWEVADRARTAQISTGRSSSGGAAQNRPDSWADRWSEICYVPLVGVESVDQLPYALADALGIALHTPEPEAEVAIRQIGAQVEDHRLLLILDSFEHLLPAARFVDLLLKVTNRLQILITSQIRLHLSEEQIVFLFGLPYPRDEMIVRADVARFAAVELFVTCARRTVADFALTPANTADVVRICRCVDGLPLGIKLAASWVSLLTPAEIATEIERSIDFLVTTDVDFPERHTGIRRVLDSTWERLEPEQRRDLAALAVFPAGFTPDAAVQITGLSLAGLRHFTDNALLVRRSDGGFELYEILRRYAGEKLAEDSAYLTALELRSLRYYTDLLDHYSTELIGPRMPAAIRVLAAEMDNLRAAWTTAIRHADWVALERMCLGIYHYCDTRGLYQEADTLFGSALERLPTPADQSAEGDAADRQVRRTYALLQGARGWFMVRRGIDAESAPLLRAAVNTLRSIGPDAESLLAHGLLWLGVDRFVHEEYAEAETLFLESVEHFTRAGDHLGIGQSNARLASAQELQGRYDEAFETMQCSIGALKEIDSYRALGFSLSSIAIFALGRGEYGQAEQALAEGYRISLMVEDQEGMLVALETIGQLRIAQGRYAEAIDYFQQVITSYKEMGAYTYIKRSLRLRAMAERLQNNFADAEADIRAYLRIAQSSRTPMSDMLGHIELGKLACARNNHTQGEDHLRKALSYAETMVRKRDAANILQALGRAVAHDGKRQKEAAALLVQALRLARIETCTPLLLETLTSLAVLSLRSGIRLGEAPEAILQLVSHHSGATAAVRQRAVNRLRMAVESGAATIPDDIHPDNLYTMVDRMLAHRALATSQLAVVKIPTTFGPIPIWVVSPVPPLRDRIRVVDDSIEVENRALPSGTVEDETDRLDSPTDS